MAYAKNTNKKKAVTLVLCGILSALVLFVAVAASVHAQFADVSLGVTPQYPKAIFPTIGAGMNWSTFAVDHTGYFVNKKY